MKKLVKTNSYNKNSLGNYVNLKLNSVQFM